MISVDDDHIDFDAGGAPMIDPDPRGRLTRALEQLTALIENMDPDDLGDWTAYPMPAIGPDERVADLGDLARFLGGSDSSFTGDVLRLIVKARYTPVNLNRITMGFPRHVIAWLMWETMTAAAPITAGALQRTLHEAHAGLRGST